MKRPIRRLRGLKTNSRPSVAETHAAVTSPTLVLELPPPSISCDVHALLGESNQPQGYAAALDDDTVSRSDDDHAQASAEEEVNEDDSYKAWWETDSFTAAYKANESHSKAVTQVRAQLQAQLLLIDHPLTHNLLLDIGATAGKPAESLGLQSLALESSVQALQLGHFERAQCFLDALKESERLPATYFRCSQLFTIQGYRLKAAGQLRSALELMPDREQTVREQRRFRDLLELSLAINTLDQLDMTDPDPKSAQRKCAGLAQSVWDTWLRELSVPDYDTVSVLLLDLYLRIIVDEELGGAVAPEVKAMLLLLMDDLIPDLIRKSHIYEAFSMFTLRIELSVSFNAHMSFLELLDDVPNDVKRIIPAFQAELQLRKAQSLDLHDRSQSDTLAELLTSASNNYKQAGHAWGDLDVQRIQILLLRSETLMSESLGVEEMLTQVVAELTDLVDEYGKVDYVVRQAQLLNVLLSMYARFENAEGIYGCHKALCEVNLGMGCIRKYWAHHIVAMAAEVGSAPEIGSFLQDCEEFPPAVLAEDPSLLVLRSKILFYVSYRTRNLPKVIEHGPTYISVLEAFDKERDASEIAHMIAAAHLTFEEDLQVEPSEHLTNFETGRSLTATWLARDRASGMHDLAAKKALLLARAFLDFGGFLPDDPIADARAALEDATLSMALLFTQLKSSMQEDALAVLADLSLEKANVEAFIFESCGELGRAILCGTTALEEHEDDIFPPSDAFMQLKVNDARRRISASGQTEPEDVEQRVPSLELAKLELTEAMKYYANESRVSEIVDCKYWIASAWSMLGEAEEAVSALAEAIHLLDFLLNDAPAAASSAIDSLQYKQGLVTKSDIRRIFALGLHLSTAHGSADGMWEWIQHSKARSLSDMLKLNTYQEHSPAVYIDNVDWLYRDLPYIQMNLDSLAPLGRMTTLQKELRTAPAERRAGIKREIWQLRRGMMRDPTLRGSLAVLTGAPATMEDLTWLSVVTSETLVFLDWAVVGDVIYLVRVQFVNGQWPPLGSDEKPKDVYPIVSMHKLQITMSEVQEWRDSGIDGHRYLDRSELSGPDAYENLNQLKEVISPIKEFTKRGDILVLCPTGALHGIPLHAIEICTDEQDEPIVLLERNPVVYTYSLSVLRQCVARAKSNLRKSAPRKAAFFGVYDGNGVNDPEPDAIKADIRECAESFDSTISFDGTVTDNEFRSRAASATSVIHFHGHTRDEGVALEQGLILANGEAFCTPRAFELELRTAPLVTLIACASVDQTTMPGDEPLGILSAFLYSGAGSTVGTLWRTLSEDGRNFTRAFYGAFEACKSNSIYDSQTPVVNLARALQHAALTIKSQEETNAPYHWAQFVLHGSWFANS